MADASTAPPILGERYQLTRRIARGGMADIYSAWDQTLDREVAVKVLFPHFAADPTFVARFKREARSAGSLNHPNVVNVYDWGAYEDTYYIVMELIDGQSLADVLRDEGPLNPDQAIYVTREVATALGFAHSRGTIHRDIKPGNIMLTSNGQVKVADFGIARARDGADDDLTQTGHVMGTAAYFSPEQAQGHPIDNRSDLYSVGIVLFEMLTGDKPFTGTSPVSVAYKHVEVQPPLVSTLAPSTPPELDTVVDVLLAKRPEQRYPTADELVSDLDRVRSGIPLQGGTGATLALGAADATTAMATTAGHTEMAPHPGEASGATRAMVQAPSQGGQPPGGDQGPYPGPGRGGGQPPQRGGDQDRGSWFLIVLAVVAFLAVGIAFVAISGILGGSEEPIADATELVPVPTVVGESQEDATRRLEEAGFLVEVSFEENDEQPPGTVLSQTPEGQTEAEPGSTVVIVVSQGAETATVPDVSGKSVEDAVAELEALGFEVSVDRDTSDTVEIDRVISQSIAPDEEANLGAQITLIVSTGPEQATVPDVTGKPEAIAEAELLEAGFSVRIETQDIPADSDQIGLVISQTPAGLTSAADGSVVLLKVGNASTTTSLTPTTTPSTNPQTTPTRPTTTRPATTTTRPTTTTTASTTTTTASTTTTSEAPPEEN